MISSFNTPLPKHLIGINNYFASKEKTRRKMVKCSLINANPFTCLLERNKMEEVTTYKGE